MQVLWCNDGQVLGEKRTCILTTCLVIWSVLRIFQCWNGFYASRQFLGMTLLLSGFTYESYLFVPIALIIQFLFIEILPFLYVLDYSFVSQVQEVAPSPTLTEPLFERNKYNYSHLDISNDLTSRPGSSEQPLGSALYSPHLHLTPPGGVPGDMMSDGGSSVGDFPNSHEMSRFSQTLNLNSMTEANYSVQSFQYPNSIFSSEEEFSLYEQYNKGEKQNPLGPLFKVKPLDEEN